MAPSASWITSNPLSIASQCHLIPMCHSHPQGQCLPEGQYWEDKSVPLNPLALSLGIIGFLRSGIRAPRLARHVAVKPRTVDTSNVLRRLRDSKA